MKPAAMMPGALLAMAALLVGCSAGPGPLGDGGIPGQACAQVRPGQTVTIGLWDLHNTGSATVTISSVHLRSPHGMTMTGAWLLPIYHDPKTGNEELLGVGYPWPPVTQPPSNWDERQPAPGAMIRPGQDLNLVFGATRATAKTARSGGPVIAYSAQGSTYTVQEKASMVFADKCF